MPITLEMLPDEQQQLPNELWQWEASDSPESSLAWRQAEEREYLPTERTTAAPIAYRQAEWKRAMGHRQAWKRMVAVVDYWTGRNTEFRNIRPWRNGMVEYEYNVVLSLCSDGRHRGNLDWDTDATPLRSGIVIPSRHNRHVYLVAGQRYPRYRAYLDRQVEARHIQEGWRNGICQNGFTVTRTPWNPKPEDEDQTVDYN